MQSSLCNLVEILSDVDVFTSVVRGAGAAPPFALISSVLRVCISPDCVLELRGAPVIENLWGENPFPYPQTSYQQSKLSNENLADGYSKTEYLVNRAWRTLDGFCKKN
jgi:hypothetical protein